MASQLQNARTLNKVVYSNQLFIPSEDGESVQDAILFTDANGQPVTSPNLTFTGSSLNIVGSLLQGAVAGATATVDGNVVLGYQNAGRHVEIETASANTASLSFHSKDNVSKDFDARILSTGGSTAANGQATLVMESNDLQQTARTVSYTPYTTDSLISYNRRDFAVNKYYYSGTLEPNASNKQIFFSTSGGYLSVHVTSKSGQYVVFANAFLQSTYPAGVTGVANWFITNPAFSGAITITGNPGSPVTVSGNRLTGPTRELSLLFQGQLPTGGNPIAFQILASALNIPEQSYYIIEYVQNINSTSPPLTP